MLFMGKHTINRHFQRTKSPLLMGKFTFFASFNGKHDNFQRKNFLLLLIVAGWWFGTFSIFPWD